jgi:hypothetical protein
MSNCITERNDEHGFYWRYDHPPDESNETLSASIMIAAQVVVEEARKARKTFCIAFAPVPNVALYILRADHPELSNTAMTVIFEATPKGRLISKASLEQCQGLVRAGQAITT